MYSGKPPSRERPTIEVPAVVSVNGFLGSQWRGPITGQRLMWTEDLPPGYDMLRVAASCVSHIALRMSNGDIQLVFVRNPTEEDNTKRGYFLTSVFMNREKPSDETLLAIELPYETVRQLSFEMDRPLTVGNIVSDGVITEIVTYDKTKPLSPDQLALIPAHTIATDFMSEIETT